MNKLGSFVRKIGIAGAIIDASIAINEALDNPTPGNVTKALLKTTLAVLEGYGKINPVVGVTLGVMDFLDITDRFFKF